MREFQLAKRAIAASMQTLMDELGIGVSDIHPVYLAGALGNHVDNGSALRTGLIPGVDPGTIKLLGNVASMGDSMVLLIKQYWQTAAGLTRFTEHIELPWRPDFNQYSIAHMGFPAENLW